MSVIKTGGVGIGIGGQTLCSFVGNVGSRDGRGRDRNQWSKPCCWTREMSVVNRGGNRVGIRCQKFFVMGDVSCREGRGRGRGRNPLIDLGSVVERDAVGFGIGRQTLLSDVGNVGCQEGKGQGWNLFLSRGMRTGSESIVKPC